MSYTQCKFIPTPNWWYLAAQPYPNDSPQAVLNVYIRSGAYAKHYIKSGPMLNKHRCNVHKCNAPKCNSPKCNSHKR